MKHPAAHALVVPISGEGHWSPMRHLLRQLVDHGISFTLLSSGSRVAEIQGYKDNWEFAGVDHVELVEVFTEIKRGGRNLTAAEILSKMQEEFTSKQSVMGQLMARKSSGIGPTFMVVDMLLSWTQDVADELGIPRYLFFSSAASLALLFLHGVAALDRGWYPGNPDRAKREEFIELPGLEKYRGEDLPPGLSVSRSAYAVHRETAPKAAGLVINSFQEVQAEEVHALRRQLQDLATGGQVARVFVIGPLLQLPTLPSVQSTKQSTLKRSRCLQFLDPQPTSSVLYICFGSLGLLSPSAITELARGLEISEVAFLWILHPPKDSPASWNVYDVLPQGFEVRTRGRGLVWTGWSPQTEVLHHLSVGGFLSHCGWNSFLEAVSGGVPIICWPLWAEQRMNARTIFSGVKVGVEIQRTVDGEIVGEEVAKAVQLLMASNTGKEQRLRMQKLRSAAAAAVLEGGSSHQDLLDFLQEVAKLSPTVRNKMPH